MRRPAVRVRWRHVSRLYEAVEPLLKAHPLKPSLPDRGTVLVIAPHIDDEVIGCGGVMRLHVEAGDPVTVIYLADCTPERREEAREASSLIGHRCGAFLPYEAKTLHGNDEVRLRMGEIILDLRPDLVYVPSLLDRHNDHLAANHHLAALYREGLSGFTVLGYEVWSTLTPNLAIDISTVVDMKRRALACFESQNRSNDWVEATLGLNRYRGVTTGAGRYAEVFLRLSAEGYMRLWERVYG